MPDDWYANYEVGPPMEISPEAFERMDRMSWESAILKVMRRGSITERVLLAQKRLYWWVTGNDLFYYGWKKKPPRTG